MLRTKSARDEGADDDQRADHGVEASTVKTAVIVGGADVWAWLAFLSAVLALAWATFRLLGSDVHGRLLLRLTLASILLLGAGTVGVFTLWKDRPGTAFVIALPVWGAAMIFAIWLGRLSRREVYQSNSPFSDLVVTWICCVVALLLVIYKLT